MLVSALLLVLAAMSACGGSEGTDWLALGDSYSSGEGTRTSDGDCGRSDATYAGLAHAEVDEGGDGRFDLVACTGARIDDVEAQLGALDERTYDVVTVTVGGNDAGYAAVLADCIGVDELRAAILDREADGELVLPLRACTATDEELSASIDAVEPRLRSLYEQVVAEHLAEDGRLLVVGYPHLFEDPATWPAGQGARCDGVSSDDVVRLRVAGDRLNDLLARVAEDLDQVTFVDPREAFAGHGRCSDEPWLNGFRLRPRPKASFHPNDEGHQALARLVVDALDAA